MCCFPEGNETYLLSADILPLITAMISACSVVVRTQNTRMICDRNHKGESGFSCSIR